MTMGSVPITGKSLTLPASLTRKLGQCGVYDAEVSFVKAEKRVKQSADELRVLIDSTYGEDAERVKSTIRRMLDGTGIMTGDPIASLQAEAMFYDRIATLIKEGKLEFRLAD